jgi:hypothetical protein
VTNNGRFFWHASTIAAARFVRHVTVKLGDPGTFPCGGPSISFQGGIVAPWAPFAPKATAMERRRAFMARSFPAREAKSNRVKLFWMLLISATIELTVPTPTAPARSRQALAVWDSF